MAGKRDNPVAHVGNYSAPVDTAGIDKAMSDMMLGTKMDKTESDYVAQAKNKNTAAVAVQRARKANKQPPVREDY
jgi:membrane protease subunit (stomatin/prohibitin family)